MFYMLIRIITAIVLATLLAIPPSYAQQYRQPTQQEIAGARALKEQTTNALRLPTNASWNQMYRTFFDQSRVAMCEEIKSKGMKGSCDWDVIQIILIATNDPEIKSQTSRDTIAALTAMKIIALKASLATGCPLLNVQSSWEELLTCAMHKSDDNRRKQLRFAPGTATEIINYVWRKEKGESDIAGNMPLLLPHTAGGKTM